MEKQKILANVGFIALIPALLLVVTGFLDLEQVKILNSPIIVLGGLFLALAINLSYISSVNARLEDGNFTGAVSIKWKDSLMNLTVIVLGFTLLGIITIYLFLENFQPFNKAKICE